jgi:glutathione S-transferase
MATNSLILYTNPMSRGRVVRWMLEEIGCDYEVKLLEYGTTMKGAEYLALNPMGKVPALQHGKAVVTETVAICTYLADLFPEANLAPKANDADARAAYYRWLFFVAGPLEAAITDKSLSIDIPRDKQGFVGYGNYELVLKTLEDLLKDREYIAGNRFSTADIIMAAYLGFYMQFGSIPANPVFEAYVKRHKNRPAAMRAEKIDNDLSPPQSKAS